MTSDVRLSVDIKQKNYGDNTPTVLKDVQLQGTAGEIVSIVGPSGAGKSTLLAMVAGLDTDYEGTITRYEFTDAQSKTFTSTSFVFQEPRLVPWLSVRDNVNLVLKKDDDATVDRLISSVGLSGYEDYFPNQLSGGMQRRLALIRAFVVKPAILLLDEPFVSLDQPTADQLRTQLMTLWSDYQPLVLFVTHNLDEAIALSDRILFMSTSPAKVIAEYAVDLARPRQASDAAVTEFRSRLLSEQPQLLQGVTKPTN